MKREIDVKELKARLDAGEPVYLVDVRQPWEHDLAALKGSTLIPLAELPARHDEIAPSAHTMVVVYCHHGIRSRSGAALLEQLGHSHVASLTGGIDAWSLLIDPGVPRY